MKVTKRMLKQMIREELGAVEDVAGLARGRGAHAGHGGAELDRLKKDVINFITNHELGVADGSEIWLEAIDDPGSGSSDQVGALNKVIWAAIETWGYFA